MRMRSLLQSVLPSRLQDAETRCFRVLLCWLLHIHDGLPQDRREFKTVAYILV